MNAYLPIGLAIAFCAALARTAEAHPGHDPATPQVGVLHYLTSPVHLAQFVVALTLLAIIYLAVRSRLDRSTAELSATGLTGRSSVDDSRKNPSNLQSTKE